MTIKTAKTDRVSSILTAATLDRLLADLDAGVNIPRATLRSAIAEARGGIDVPDHYLSDTERATEVIEVVQAAADPLLYARSVMTQDFFNNPVLPHEMRRQIASFLWGEFGPRGNPIWKNYLDGTFKYIQIDDIEGDD